MLLQGQQALLLALMWFEHLDLMRSSQKAQQMVGEMLVLWTGPLPWSRLVTWMCLKFPRVLTETNPRISGRRTVRSSTAGVHAAVRKCHEESRLLQCQTRGTWNWIEQAVAVGYVHPTGQILCQNARGLMWCGPPDVLSARSLLWPAGRRLATRISPAEGWSRTARACCQGRQYAWRKAGNSAGSRRCRIWSGQGKFCAARPVVLATVKSRRLWFSSQTSTNHCFALMLNVQEDQSYSRSLVRNVICTKADLKNYPNLRHKSMDKTTLILIYLRVYIMNMIGINQQTNLWNWWCSFVTSFTICKLTSVSWIAMK